MHIRETAERVMVAHAQQMRRGGSTPYFAHLLNVIRILIEDFGIPSGMNGQTLSILMEIAFLHDTREDQSVLYQIISGFDAEAVQRGERDTESTALIQLGVALLTHLKKTIASDEDQAIFYDRLVYPQDHSTDPDMPPLNGFAKTLPRRPELLRGIQLIKLASRIANLRDLSRHYKLGTPKPLKKASPELAQLTDETIGKTMRYLLPELVFNKDSHLTPEDRQVFIEDLREIFRTYSRDEIPPALKIPARRALRDLKRMLRHRTNQELLGHTAQSLGQEEISRDAAGASLGKADEDGLWIAEPAQGDALLPMEAFSTLDTNALHGPPASWSELESRYMRTGGRTRVGLEADHEFLQDLHTQLWTREGFNGFTMPDLDLIMMRMGQGERLMEGFFGLPVPVEQVYFVRRDPRRSAFVSHLAQGHRVHYNLAFAWPEQIREENDVISIHELTHSLLSEVVKRSPTFPDSRRRKGVPDEEDLLRALARGVKIPRFTLIRFNPAEWGLAEWMGEEFFRRNLGMALNELITDRISSRLTGMRYTDIYARKSRNVRPYQEKRPVEVLARIIAFEELTGEESRERLSERWKFVKEKLTDAQIVKLSAAFRAFFRSFDVESAGVIAPTLWISSGWKPPAQTASGKGRGPVIRASSLGSREGAAAAGDSPEGTIGQSREYIDALAGEVLKNIDLTASVGLKAIREGQKRWRYSHATGISTYWKPIHRYYGGDAYQIEASPDGRLELILLMDASGHDYQAARIVHMLNEATHIYETSAAESGLSGRGRLVDRLQGGDREKMRLVLSEYISFLSRVMDEYVQAAKRVNAAHYLDSLRNHPIPAESLVPVLGILFPEGPISEHRLDELPDSVEGIAGVLTDEQTNQITLLPPIRVAGLDPREPEKITTFRIEEVLPRFDNFAMISINVIDHEARTVDTMTAGTNPEPIVIDKQGRRIHLPVSVDERQFPVPVGTSSRELAPEVLFPQNATLTEIDFNGEAPYLISFTDGLMEGLMKRGRDALRVFGNLPESETAGLSPRVKELKQWLQTLEREKHGQDEVVAELAEHFIKARLEKTHTMPTPSELRDYLIRKVSMMVWDMASVLSMDRSVAARFIGGELIKRTNHGVSIIAELMMLRFTKKENLTVSQWVGKMKDKLIGREGEPRPSWLSEEAAAELEQLFPSRPIAAFSRMLQLAARESRGEAFKNLDPAELQELLYILVSRNDDVAMVITQTDPQAAVFKTEISSEPSRWIEIEAEKPVYGKDSGRYLERVLSSNGLKVLGQPERIGSGNFGDVYRVYVESGEGKEKGRRVMAVKMIGGEIGFQTQERYGLVSHNLEKDDGILRSAWEKGIGHIPEYYGRILDEDGNVVAMMMEYVEGRPVNEEIVLNPASEPALRGMVEEVLRDFEKYDLGLWDPQPSVFVARSDGTLVLIDIGSFEVGGMYELDDILERAVGRKGKCSAVISLLRSPSVSPEDLQALRENYPGLDLGVGIEEILKAARVENPETLGTVRRNAGMLGIEPSVIAKVLGEAVSGNSLGDSKAPRVLPQQNALLLLTGFAGEKDLAAAVSEKGLRTIPEIEEFLTARAREGLERLRRDLERRSEDFIGNLARAENFFDAVLSPDLEKEISSLFELVSPGVVQLSSAEAARKIRLAVFADGQSQERLEGEAKAQEVTDRQIEAAQALLDQAQEKIRALAGAQNQKFSLVLQHMSSDMEPALDALQGYSQILKFLVILHTRDQKISRADLARISVPSLDIVLDIANPGRAFQKAVKSVERFQTPDEALPAVLAENLAVSPEIAQTLLSILTQIRQVPTRLKKQALNAVLVLIFALALKTPEQRAEILGDRSGNLLGKLLDELGIHFLQRGFQVTEGGISLNVNEFISSMVRAQAEAEAVGRAA
ncbi:MAG TPA: hypothetical protein PKL97_05525 [Candidatus Omnitrophota bacterium]|nr:hypothetical protein [Candidatus Omnitrophota bacterium]